MRIFYDTEFCEDGVRLDLISIGLVREDGVEYYAVNENVDGGRVLDNPWLREHVVPHLPLINEYGTEGFALDSVDDSVKPRSVIADEVAAFISATPHPSLWAWFASFDHVALTWLFGPMVNMPEEIPMRTNDLKQEAERLGDPILPEQRADLHHALADARHNRVVADHLDRLAASRDR
ncbi:hypothetical protein ABZ635_08005 [Nocardiopsis sp. NPDC007018]|uniref:hypothetical protein n=1 Tax=Nocardiopsis sp. NPDC007018 TaxID=3155721 RepID=UPI0033CD3D75